MSLPFPRTLAAAALALAAPPPGPSHTWIASLKANPAAIAGRTAELKGEVVDVRSTSPTGRGGLYRLVDASDPAGVLLRTDDLPVGGGSFRVNASLAAGVAQPGGDLLLLDEIQRTRTDGRPLAPLAALTLSTLFVLGLAVLSGRAVRDQRHYQVAPPLWLLPDAGPYGKTAADPGPALPALRYEPELEAADRQHHLRLRHRKRALLTGLGASAALAGSSALWVAATLPTAPMVPAFIFLSADDSTPPAASTIPVRPTPLAPPPPESRRQPAAVVKPLGRDTGPVRRSSPAAAPAAAVTTEPLPPPAVPAAPQPSAPAAAPVVTAPQPARPPAPPPPPARDPEADRAEASSALEKAAARLVAAINGKRDAEVAQLLPEERAGDRSRRARFLQLIKEFGPRAVLGTVEEPTLAGDRGEAKFSLSLSWRGDFGVTNRKPGGFLGVVRRQDGGGWRFEGARLLDDLP